MCVGILSSCRSSADVWELVALWGWDACCVCRGLCREHIPVGGMVAVAWHVWLYPTWFRVCGAAGAGVKLGSVTRCAVGESSDALPSQQLLELCCPDKSVSLAPNRGYTRQQLCQLGRRQQLCFLASQPRLTCVWLHSSMFELSRQVSPVYLSGASPVVALVPPCESSRDPVHLLGLSYLSTCCYGLPIAGTCCRVCWSGLSHKGMSPGAVEQDAGSHAGRAPPSSRTLYQQSAGMADCFLPQWMLAQHWACPVATSSLACTVVTCCCCAGLCSGLEGRA